LESKKPMEKNPKNSSNSISSPKQTEKTPKPEAKSNPKDEVSTKLQTNSIGIEEFIKVGIVGNVDSGKSTLVGVLSKGILDDGRGSARVKVFNYPHEVSNGRTSSVGHEIMGFDKKTQKQVFAARFVQNKNKYWAEVVKQSNKIVTLIDLCGHEKYLKTTIYGLVGCIPDYVLVVVGANLGLSKMTKEHLGIVLALEIPFFIVVTKVDMVAPEILKKTIKTLSKLLTCSAVSKKAMVVNYENENEIDVAVKALKSTKVCPIFKVSNVTNYGMPELTKFFFNLDNRVGVKELGKPTDTVEFDIHEKFLVTGVGLVVSGLLKSGKIVAGQNLFLGPDKYNKFKMVQVRSIHFARVPVDSVFAGQFCCLALKSLKKKEELKKGDIRKGIVLLEAGNLPKSCRGFEAEVAVLHHSSTIKKGYESVIHCGVIRQSVRIIDMDKGIIRTGDKAIIKFRFMFNPEYVKPNSTFLLREGRTKILGQITRLYEKMTLEGETD
jgi:GTPase